MMMTTMTMMMKKMMTTMILYTCHRCNAGKNQQFAHLNLYDAELAAHQASEKRILLNQLINNILVCL